MVPILPHLIRLETHVLAFGQPSIQGDRFGEVGLTSLGCIDAEIPNTSAILEDRGIPVDHALDLRGLRLRSPQHRTEEQQDQTAKENSSPSLRAV